MIPGDCTKYIQAPNMVWNRPFTNKIHEKQVLFCEFAIFLTTDVL